MNLKLELEFSKADILKDIDALKKQIDDMRPLPEDVEGRVMQKLRLDWNYHSNAIEGNRLNYGETVAFLMEGITAKGKPLKDHLDIRGHNEAINFLLEIVKDTRPISEADIRALHKMILVESYDAKAKTAEGLPTTKRITLGEYKTSPNHVKTATGEIHYYATPEETPAKMQELMEWYGEAVNKGIHPVVIAALFHHKFVEIHPFDDGNGRLSRILMNLILMQNGCPPVVVKMDDRTNYYSLLSRADVGDSWPFVEHIAERLQSSFQLYVKAANGIDIDEEEDVDKEIALFKLELQNQIVLKEKRSVERIKDILTNDLLQLFKKIYIKTNEFDEFFFNSLKFYHIEFVTNEGGIETANFLFGKNPFELKDNFNNIKTAYLYCGFNEFKGKKVFDVKIAWSIKFEEYNYAIYNEEKKIVLSKLYHEVITNQEQQNLIKLYIKELRNVIQVKL